MSSNRRLKRTELFFVRVMVEEQPNAEARAEGTGIACKGNVQRVVNGDSRRFDSLEGLIDTVAAMLSEDVPDNPGRPTTGDPRPRKR